VPELAAKLSAMVVQSDLAAAPKFACFGSRGEDFALVQLQQ
jgi:hypothetical protein